MGKFKIGDRVRRIGTFNSELLQIGDTGTVTAIDSAGDCRVLPDKGEKEQFNFAQYLELIITITPGKHYRCRNGKVTDRVSTGDIGFEALVDGQVKVFDKAGGHVFGDGEFDIVEAWAPKVGERVRLVKDGKSTTGAIGKGATLVAWDTGTFIDNNDYLLDIDPPVDYRTMSVKENFTRATIDCFEPLPVAAQAQPLRIVAGRYYKTRDGRKVGPMKNGEQCPTGPWFYKFGDNHFEKGGKSCFGGIGFQNRPGDDLIAEWVDEPAVLVAASNDNAAPAAAKFKVGDRVRLTSEYFAAKQGATAIVRKVREDGMLDLEWVRNSLHRGQSDGGYYPSNFEPVAPKPQPTAIVCLIENGQPKPSSEPHVHASTHLATIEADRLSGIHKGQLFGVYALVTTSQEAVQAYKHEWQRLAAKGEKINAIKELRSITGMQLKPAKDVVEGFIAYPYGAIAA